MAVMRHASCVMRLSSIPRLDRSACGSHAPTLHLFYNNPAGKSGNLTCSVYKYLYIYQLVIVNFLKLYLPRKISRNFLRKHPIRVCKHIVPQGDGTLRIDNFST